MSLTTVMRTANSGMMAAQTGLRAVSDNIANVNTPGYVRKTVDQAAISVNGIGMGVEVTGLRRVTDQYLQLANLTASSDTGRWAAVSRYTDNAQSLFGDPSGKNYFFSRLDDIWSAFGAAANDPSSSLLRSQALTQVGDFFTEASRINAQLDELRNTVDGQVVSDVARSNDLLTQITRLNSDITRANLSGGDASGAENIQSQLVNELATLMNVQVQARPNGGVNLRSTEGVLLAGDSAATLVYNRTDTTRGYLSVSPLGGVGLPQPIQVTGGDIRGLLDLRDDKLPGMADQLGEFTARAAEQINRAHNTGAASPAPSSLTGRDTGLDSATAASGFTGQASVAIVNAAGVATTTVAIDFTAGTLSVNGGPTTATSAATFVTDLNAALGAAGGASFANGKLTISAANGDGVAIDEGTSMKAGRAFSHFYGLNDLVRSGGMITYETGLAATDPHGFTPGSTVTFRLAQADGKPLRDVVVTMPALTTIQDLLNSLNSPTAGVGVYGSFALDAKGALSFTGPPPVNANISVVTDTTSRLTGGASFSQMFGVGLQERGGRTQHLMVDPVIQGNPMNLAFAKLDLSVAPGQPNLRPGDGRGALALSQAGDTPAGFAAAGALGPVTMTVSRYATEFGGSVGRDAKAAEVRQQAAEAVQTEATARLQSVEGVNLDEELVRLNTYQQAFNASARMIQAAKDLFDILANIVT